MKLELVRFMKRKQIIILVTFLGLALTGLIFYAATRHRHSWDVGNLEIAYLTESLESISFADAVSLEAELAHGGLLVFAEDNLRKLEQEILEKTGKEAKYYCFTGGFSVAGSDEVQGVLKTLIVVAEDTIPYIYTVRDPLTDMWCVHGDVQWVHQSSYFVIDADMRSVRLEAVGYITMTEKSDSDTVSNALKPVYHVVLPQQ